MYGRAPSGVKKSNCRNCLRHICIHVVDSEILERRLGPDDSVLPNYSKNSMMLVLLLIITAAVYAPALQFDFLNYDDDEYVTANPYLAGGLSAEVVRWSLTAYHSHNWHPLTWLSHAADVSLFGLNPAGHHATSIVVHLLNTLLLYLFLSRATGRKGAALFVAGLFALHPTHVSSVAWVAERKDVLSTCFAFLALLAYDRYTRRPNVLRMALVVLLVALGLAAKPMLVTLPCVLLLLDLWPYGRMRIAPTRESLRCVAQCLVEKIPLFLLVVWVSWLTVRAQEGALNPLESVSFLQRTANAIVAYATYLGMMLWPSGLATPYPFDPEILTGLRVGLMGIFLLIVTLLAIATLRRAPWLMVGWLWYLGTLVPVIGLVKVGNQAMADRYTYIPYVGVFIVIVWAITLLLERVRISPRIPLTLACVVLALCAVLTSLQLRHWRNSETLFRRAIAVTSNNTVAHNNLGNTLMAQGRIDEAITHYEAAVAAAPGNLNAKNNLAITYLEVGAYKKAQGLFVELLEKTPNDPEVLLNAALLMARGGDIKNARSYARHALEVAPDFEKAKVFLETVHE